MLSRHAIQFLDTRNNTTRRTGPKRSGATNCRPFHHCLRRKGRWTYVIECVAQVLLAYQLLFELRKHYNLKTGQFGKVSYNWICDRRATTGTHEENSTEHKPCRHQECKDKQPSGDRHCSMQSGGVVVEKGKGKRKFRVVTLLRATVITVT